MRLLIVAGIAGLSLVSCQRNEQVVKAQPELPEVKHDTLYIQAPCDTGMYVYIIDSMKQKNDTLAQRLMAAKFQLSTIRYYVNICNRNRSQNKFLLGWMNRALKD